MAVATMGHQTRFGLGINSGNVATREFEVLQNGLVKDAQHLQAEGMRGQRGYDSQGVVEGVIAVGGVVVMEPRPDDLAFLLSYIMGGTPAGTSFPLADTELGELCAESAKGLSAFRHSGLKVNSAIFRSSVNNKLTLDLDLQGKTETSGITFANIAATLSTQAPYVHHQLVATFGGTAYKVSSVELMISHGLKLDRFYNTQTRSSLPEGNRVITLAVDVPFTTDEAALYDIALAGLGTNTLVWTNGSRSLTFTMGRLQAPTRGPAVSNRGDELGFRLNFDVRATGATPALATVNVSA
jgi:hypothetical protein